MKITHWQLTMPVPEEKRYERLNPLPEVLINDWQISEKYEWVKDLKRKHIAFLESLPFVVNIPSHKLLIVHAGLVPGTDIEKQVDLCSLAEKPAHTGVVHYRTCLRCTG